VPLKTLGVIEIPNAAGSEFDHAAFDPKSRRVLVAHATRDCKEVIDDNTQKHIATLPGFPGVAGAVADGEILTTNRNLQNQDLPSWATAQRRRYRQAKEYRHSRASRGFAARRRGLMARPQVVRPYRRGDVSEDHCGLLFASGVALMF
jgi:hypothetical protein